MSQDTLAQSYEFRAEVRQLLLETLASSKPIPERCGALLALAPRAKEIDASGEFPLDRLGDLGELPLQVAPLQPANGLNALQVGGPAAGHPTPGSSGSSMPRPCRFRRCRY